jgi:processive 1,2-diacylglycerol beta-glucosyltransferase
MPHIKILYAETGGGHKSVAESIKMAVQELAPEITVSLDDGSVLLGKKKDILSELYKSIANGALWFYEMFYHMTNGTFQREFYEEFLSTLFEEEVRKYLKDDPADIYVSCHPVFTLMMPRFVHDISGVGFVSVITDPFTPHTHNFSKYVDLCIVSSNSSREIAISCGVKEERVKVLGHPVYAHEHVEFDEVAFLSEHGLDDSCLTILLAGGADGIGGIYEVVLELSGIELPIQIIVVCGRNIEVFEKVSNIKGKVRVRPFGYIRNLHEMMLASDILISKPGASTMYEAFSHGLPIIVYGKVMSQEAGNVSYIVENHAGMYCATKKELIDCVNEIVNSPELLRSMSIASKSLSNNRAAFDVSRECLAIMGKQFSRS